MTLEIVVVVLLVVGGILVASPGYWGLIAPVFTIAGAWVFAKYFERRRPR